MKKNIALTFALILLAGTFSSTLFFSNIAIADDYQPLASVGIYAQAYPYSEKSHFLKIVHEKFRFYEEAISNLKEPDEHPEVQEHAKKTIPIIEENLKALKVAYGKASSANENEWPSEEVLLKNALVKAKLAYLRANNNALQMNP